MESNAKAWTATETMGTLSIQWEWSFRVMGKGQLIQINHVETTGWLVIWGKNT